MPHGSYGMHMYSGHNMPAQPSTLAYFPQGDTGSLGHMPPPQSQPLLQIPQPSPLPYSHTQHVQHPLHQHIQPDVQPHHPTFSPAESLSSPFYHQPAHAHATPSWQSEFAALPHHSGSKRHYEGMGGAIDHAQTLAPALRPVQPAVSTGGARFVSRESIGLLAVPSVPQPPHGSPFSAPVPPQGSPFAPVPQGSPFLSSQQAHR